ncbi:MAG: DUF4065 domain-containing protein [Clostridia bacterium]|nr:DUF4065 domain-containing protein [Clostridia bacterium]
MPKCWFLVRYGKPLFHSRIEAWDQGPVVPAVDADFKIYGIGPLHAIPVDYSQFTADEFSTILDVFTHYGKFSASGLRELSIKSGSPWDAVYVPGTVHREITTDAMEEYFKHQSPLETVADRLLKSVYASGREVITPPISASGNPILPADDYEDWGDWGDWSDD